MEKTDAQNTERSLRCNLSIPSKALDHIDDVVGACNHVVVIWRKNKEDAGKRTRTSTGVRPSEPKSDVSANSTTPALYIDLNRVKRTLLNLAPF